MGNCPLPAYFIFKGRYFSELWLTLFFYFNSCDILDEMKIPKGLQRASITTALLVLGLLSWSCSKLELSEPLSKCLNGTCSDQGRLGETPGPGDGGGDSGDGNEPKVFPTSQGIINGGFFSSAVAISTETEGQRIRVSVPVPANRFLPEPRLSRRAFAVRGNQDESVDLEVEPQRLTVSFRARVIRQASQFPRVELPQLNSLNELGVTGAYFGGSEVFNADARLTFGMSPSGKILLIYQSTFNPFLFQNFPIRLSPNQTLMGSYGVLPATDTVSGGFAVHIELPARFLNSIR